MSKSASAFRLVTLVLATAAAACGPSVSGDDDDDDGNGGADAGNGSCIVQGPEVCTDLIDNDCDGRFDCDDSDCHSQTACNTADDNCGTLDSPGGMLSLPDGACPEDETQPCMGFENSLNFTGFTAGQTLPDITGLRGICVNMEHSWMRDLVVYAQCPTGVRVMLSDFEGHTGGAVYLGVPNDADEGNPTPGTGWDYCWRPTATNMPWIPYANANATGFQYTLPAGDYQSSQPLDAFVGCPLNGLWTIRVEDRWGIDNGFIFNWTVEFDAGLVEDCDNWPG
jgi:hypothetical protein